MDSVVVASIIEGLFTFFAALIPSMLGYRAFVQWKDARTGDALVLRLAKQLKYLQFVEKEAVSNGNLTKIKLRAKVFEEYGLRSDGGLGPAKVENIIAAYEQKVEDVPNIDC